MSGGLGLILFGVICGAFGSWLYWRGKLIESERGAGRMALMACEYREMFKMAAVPGYEPSDKFPELAVIARESRNLGEMPFTPRGGYQPIWRHHEELKAPPKNP